MKKNFIPLSIIGRHAILALRQKMPTLTSLDREHDYNSPGDHLIYVSWEAKTDDLSMSIEGYGRKCIEPAVDALISKMKEHKGTPVLVNLPKPSFPEKVADISYDGLILRCFQGYNFPQKGYPLGQAYFGIAIACSVN